MAADVAAVWRGAQLDYAFRVTIMDDYEDFAGLTRRALDFALLDRGLDLDPQVRAGLVSAYDRLPTFPDVAPGLAALAAAGTECVLLSNGSPTMLAACLRTAGLAPWFSHVISVDDVRVYKPHPAVYRHAAAVTGRPVESIRLVSCNPFDIVGAARAGMRTAWIDRSGRTFDTLGRRPDVVVRELSELAKPQVRPAR